MKKIAMLVLLACFAFSATTATFQPAEAWAKSTKKTTSVKSYKKKDGTKVKAHKRSKASKKFSSKKRK